MYVRWLEIFIWYIWLVQYLFFLNAYFSVQRDACKFSYIHKVQLPHYTHWLIEIYTHTFKHEQADIC